jgi:hypothetical protein
MVIRNGRIVSLFECEWLSKMRKTTTLAVTSIAADVTIANLRPRMGPSSLAGGRTKPPP